jgi:hypothetical protein
MIRMNVVVKSPLTPLFQCGGLDQFSFIKNQYENLCFLTDFLNANCELFNFTHCNPAHSIPHFEKGGLGGFNDAIPSKSKFFYSAYTAHPFTESVFHWTQS